MECSCASCQNACKYKPGWFKYGEIEKAAELKNLTVKQFFDLYCSVDWWMGGSEELPNTVFVISPVIVNVSEEGGMMPWNAVGTCIHYKEGLCDIHKAKPSECILYMHGNSQEKVESAHKAMAKSWNTPEAQQQIEDLLGHEPCEPDSPSLFDVLSFLR